MINQTLSHYKIIEKLGAGGMGEVYRAEDTKLDRQVALKVLPDVFAADPERLARFEREAKLLASLNHPNIAAIYGLEEAGGKRFIVQELVEGETLAERIRKGPLPVEEALETFRQIAEGLESAHEKGVIHRDLKPANVKITPEGQVKVLDFGLAKAFQEQPAVADLSHSPTITESMTQEGVILGTAAYMSPEQAKGKPVDKKADIWAFGCLLYEMLTGRRTFEGEAITDTLGAIIHKEPNWEALPNDVPWNIRTLLQRCLTKDPKERLHDISDARIEINQAIREPTTTVPLLAGKYSKKQLIIAGTLIGLMIFVIGAVISWNLKQLPEPEPKLLSRFIHTLPEDQGLTSTGRPVLTISPDGTRIVYVANLQLYQRKIDEVEAIPIRGTDESPINPFFSPDSQWIGFYSSDDSALKKIAVTGGTPVKLCAATNLYSASWGSDNTIVFGQGQTIMRVSDNGGTPEVLINLEPDEMAYGPQILPGGEKVLFAVTSTTGADRWDMAQIVTQSLETGEQEVLIPAGAEARYVPTGHIVYALEDTVYAVPYDLASNKVTGGAVPILEGVMRALNPSSNTGAANFRFSNLGSLIYIPGGLYGSEMVLAFADRDGTVERLPAPTRNYNWPRVSPDGKRVAVHIDSGEDSNVWIYDITRKTLDQLTFEGGERPCWTPDGKRVAFTSNRDGAQNIYWKSADFSGEAERLTTSENLQYPHSWSPEGDILIFAEQSQTTNWDIWSLALEEGSEPQPIIQTEAIEFGGCLSPNGRWLAYYSMEEGPRDVYVQAFPPGSGGKWRISTERGRNPRWAESGEELFYWESSNRLMAVKVTTDPTFTRENPVPLLPRPGSYYRWDIAPDGNRILVMQPAEGAESPTGSTQIHIVLNWFEELKRLCPTDNQ